MFLKKILIEVQFLCVFGGNMRGVSDSDVRMVIICCYE